MTSCGSFSIVRATDRACILGVERFANGFADKGDQGQQEDQRAKCGDHDPRRSTKVGGALLQQLAQTGRRQAKAEKIEGSHRGDGRDDRKRHKGDQCCQHVRQDVSEYDPAASGADDPAEAV